MEINPPEKLQFNLSGDNGGPAMLSPDGRYIVFSANGTEGTQLYLRRLDSLTAQPLVGTEGGTFPFWSPDSRSVGFFTADRLKRIEANGGTPVTICNANLGRGASWNQNGEIIAALSYNSGISRVSASGGAPTPISQANNTVYSSHRFPWFLPDGKHFVYVAVNHNAPTSADTAVFFATIDGKENRLLLHTLSNAIYASGYLLYQRDNSLIAQPFDPGAGKFTGDPQTMGERVQYDAGLWRMNLSASNVGTLLYASGTPGGTQAIAWLDRAGKQLSMVGDRGDFFDLDLSPDGKKTAVAELNTRAATIWVYDLLNKVKSRITFTGGAHQTPTFSPDGKQVAFTSNQNTAISAKTLGSSDPERTLLSAPNPIFQGVTDWSRDGRYIMYEQGPDLNLQLWVLPMFGDGKPFAYTNTASKVQERGGTFSPDGRWVAYMSDEGGRPEIFVSPFPWTGTKWQISNGGGADPRWRSDGKELFYFDFNGITAVEVNGAGSAFEVGGSKQLFRLPVRGISREFAPSKDGQRFLAIVPTSGISQQLTFVQNWPAELKKK